MAQLKIMASYFLVVFSLYWIGTQYFPQGVVTFLFVVALYLLYRGQKGNH